MLARVFYVSTELCCFLLLSSACTRMHRLALDMPSRHARAVDVKSATTTRACGVLIGLRLEDIVPRSVRCVWK